MATHPSNALLRSPSDTTTLETTARARWSADQALRLGFKGSFPTFLETFKAVDAGQTDHPYVKQYGYLFATSALSGARAPAGAQGAADTNDPGIEAAAHASVQRARGAMVSHAAAPRSETPQPTTRGTQMEPAFAISAFVASMTDPFERKCAVTWEMMPSLKAEFGGNFKNYCAYRRAVENGQVKGVGRSAITRADLFPVQAIARSQYGAGDLEACCRQEWDQRADLRAEFKKFENYHAYCKAVQGGLIRGA